MTPTAASGTLDVAGDGQPFGPDVNVKAIYERIAGDIANGTTMASTFDDAVSLHKLLDDIRQSSATGRRVTASALNRVLP
jgi:predicted dehydrogenase